jgi:hypothetical protein
MAMCALLLANLAAAPAMAQKSPPTAQAKETALTRAKQGWALYRTGRYEEALKAFREAESRVHAPTFLLMVAHSCSKLGRLIEARSVYQIVVDEQLPADAPPAFLRAQADAKKELGAIAPRIPTVEIAVTGAAPGTARVMLDGMSVAPSSPVERDPGSHTLVAGSPGRGWLTKDIVLAEGAKARVAVDLAAGEVRVVNEEDALRAAAAAAEAPRQSGEGAVSRTIPSKAKPPGGRSSAVVVGGIAATAVGVSAGAAFAVASFVKSDAQKQLLEPTCGDPTHCPGLDLHEYNRLGHARADLANASVWSFAAAGALGLGTIAYVLLTKKPTSPDATATGLSVMAGPGRLVIGTSW